jgi:exodeoxyribonuclease VII large subunit
LAQRVDDAAERLPRALTQRTAQSRADFAAIAPRLQPRLLRARIERGAEKLAGLWRLAELAHPEKPLQRGFVRVTDRQGGTLVHAAAAREARAVDLHFADGVVAATTGDSASAGPHGFQPRRVERAARKPYLPGQPGLFDAPEE